MLIALTEAPIGKPLGVVRIADQGFAERMAHLGIYPGGSLTRQDETVAIGPAKIEGPSGRVALSGGLAAQIVIHLDDGRRQPLLECAPGDSGHLEGVTGRQVVEETLAALGVRENDRITFLRRLPPMLYTAVIDGKERIRINESLAAKVLGDTPSGPVQFCAVGVDEPFTVRRILAGAHAAESLETLGVSPGRNLTLVSVAAGQVLGFSGDSPVVCATSDGLRLYIKQDDARKIMVQVAKDAPA